MKMEKKLSYETVFLQTSMKASLFDRLGGCDDVYEFAHFIGEAIYFYLKREEKLYEVLNSYDVIADRRIAKQFNQDESEVSVLVEMAGAIFNELQGFCEEHHMSYAFVVNMAILQYFDDKVKSEQFSDVYSEVYNEYFKTGKSHPFDDVNQFLAYKKSLPIDQAKYVNKDYWYRYDDFWEINYLTKEKIKKMNYKHED